MVERAKYSSCVAMLVILISYGVQCDRERLRELVHVCTGHDLFNAIKKSCAIYKRRKRISVIEPTHPLQVKLEDVTKICCAVPCRISLFFLLCS